jgi:hypothetical protein
MKKILILTALLASCAGTTLPQTFVERVAYAEATAQSLIKTIDDLVCTKPAANGCAEPGKPLSAPDARKALDRVESARRGLKTAALMPDGGGDCLGEKRTPVACLTAARAILLEIESELQKRSAK